MREIDNSVPVKTETRNAIRAQKTGGQTYDDVVRAMAALYIEARRQAESEMSGHERIQARANDVSPVEYVHDLDVDAVIAQATRRTDADGDQDDGADTGTGDDVARAALGGRELVEAEARDQDPEDFIWDEFGLDASNYDDAADLRDEIHAAASDQDGDQGGRKKPDDFDAPATAQQAGDGTDADALAEKALSGQDRVAAQASDQSPASYVRQEYGVDPADYADPGDLRTAMEGE